MIEGLWDSKEPSPRSCIAVFCINMAGVLYFIRMLLNFVQKEKYINEI